MRAKSAAKNGKKRKLQFGTEKKRVKARASKKGWTTPRFLGPSARKRGKLLKGGEKRKGWACILGKSSKFRRKVAGGLGGTRREGLSPGEGKEKAPFGCRGQQTSAKKTEEGRGKLKESTKFPKKGSVRIAYRITAARGKTSRKQER